MTVSEPIFMKRMLAKNSYTQFHENPTTVYSLMLGERQTDGRMWSLQRTTQTDFYNNDASCLLSDKN